MNRSTVVCFTLALALSLCACQTNCPPDPAPTPEETPAAATQPMASVSVVTDCGDIRNGDTLLLSWNLDRAAASGTPGAEAVNEHQAAAEQSFLDWTQELAGDAKELFDNNPNWGMAYQTIRSVTPERADARVVSLSVMTYSFTGGAHGYEYTTGAVYDAQTGEELTLAMLSEDEQALRDFLTEQILTQSKSEAFGGGDWFFEGYEDDVPGLVADGRWYFDGVGMVFTSDPYELAAYAAGMIPFTVPYASLQDHIDAKWIPTA